jgi:alkylation response protein AidB-like acyl-CoA dehydrogenase
VSLVLSPEQELIQSVVREFAKKDLEKDATPMDRDGTFREEHLQAMAGLGLLGMMVPEAAGGAGVDTLSYIIAAEEVARVSGTDATVLVITNSVVTQLLTTLATEEQRQEILAPVLAGKQVVAVALAEESTGSAHEGMRTVWESTPKGERLRGSKTFVAMAPIAGNILVLAKHPKGPVLVNVPKDAKGLHLGANESKLGLRGLPLTDLYLNRVPVDPGQQVGQPGAALKALEEPLNLARLGVAASLVGLTQACLDAAIAFSKERYQFGQPISKFGAVRGMLADVQAQLDAARATTYGAAALRDAGKPYIKETYEARLLAHRVAVSGSRIAHKVHGGAGFMRDLPLERFSRDIRTLMHLWDAQDIVRSRLAGLLVD